MLLAVVDNVRFDAYVSGNDAVGDTVDSDDDDDADVDADVDSFISALSKK